MHVSKHHGLGNDFLVLVDLDDAHPVGPELVRALCHRRRGVGADGFVRATAGSGEADVTMVLHNADGSRAEMSGNGIRCLAQALARQRGAQVLEASVATAAGVRRVALRPGPEPLTAWVEVDMGVSRPGRLPSGGVEVGIAHKEVAAVDLGNPHLVLLVDDPAAVDLGELGPQVAGQFEHGVNVEVIAPAPGRPGTLDLRVWERGAGATQACGTGACAAAAAASEWGLVGEQVRVRMPGGEVDVELGSTITLAGPAVFVADVEAPCP